MKTYFSDLVPRLQKYSQKLDDCSLLMNHQWVLINELHINKTTYIFREKGELLLAENGIVTRGKWEYLNTKSLLVESREGMMLVNQSFGNEETLILSLDGSNNYAFFINESKFHYPVNNLHDLEKYLEEKYLKGIFVSPSTKYFYIEKAREFGPFTALVIRKKVEYDGLSKMCFVREEADENYHKEVRIKDLLHKL